MGQSCFLRLLLVSSLLVLLFSTGLGRNLRTAKLFEASSAAEPLGEEERGRMEVMDYGEPQPNTNRNGYTVAPPPHDSSPH